MTPVEVLRQARDLWLAHPTTEVFARDARGIEVYPDAPEATCWCAVGALRKCGDASAKGLMALAEVLSSGSTLQQLDVIAKRNDNGTLTREHWDAAIRSLGGEP